MACIPAMTQPVSVKPGEEVPVEVVKEKQVAQQFVKLFYTILNNHPQYLVQFYGEGSSIIVTESRDGSPTPLSVAASDQQAIGPLLVSLFAGVQVSVETAVPQKSLSDSVVLVVTGKLTRQDSNESRMFVQAFVLARQEKGYFIRTDNLHVHSRGNSRDFFRLEETQALSADEQSADKENEPVRSFDIVTQTSTVATSTVQAAQQIHTPEDNSSNASQSESEEDEHLLVEQHESPESVESVSDNGAIVGCTKKSYAEAVLKGVWKSPAPKKQEASPKPNPPPKAPQPATGSTSQGQTPKVREAKETPAENGTKKQPKEHPAAAKTASSRNKKSARGPPAQTTPQAPECPSDRSIFVCRLPLGITEAQVAEEFSKHGTLLGGEEGVRVRTGPNACYAFITYSTPEGAAAALENVIEIGGEAVVSEMWNPRPKPERRSPRGTGTGRGRGGRQSSRRIPVSVPDAASTNF
ncbi:hypothetical protein BSKO_09012 [Bryopsis sp. KO-2023]|nr:hypothetical protein BSKO_09012 [Bryopsis sp. KO-2023]